MKTYIHQTMKKLLFLFAFALVSCDTFYSSEHSVVVNNWSSHPIFFESTYGSKDTVIYLEVDETEIEIRRTDTHVIPEDFHSEYDFKLFSIQGQDTIESSFDINLLELQHYSYFDSPYYFYGYRLRVKDSLF